ncbi:hypothetical protein AB0B09_27300, partial [Streptomyces sp. NPDC044948]
MNEHRRIPSSTSGAGRRRGGRARRRRGGRPRLLWPGLAAGAVLVLFFSDGGVHRNAEIER